MLYCDKIQTHHPGVKIATLPSVSVLSELPYHTKLLQQINHIFTMWCYSRPHHLTPRFQFFVNFKPQLLWPHNIYNYFKPLTMSGYCGSFFGISVTNQFSTFKTKPFNVRRTYLCIFIRSMRKSKYLNVLKMRPIITQNNMHVTYYQQNAPWNFLCPQNLRGWQVYHATCSAQGLPTGLVYAFAVTQMPLDSCVAENVSDITSRLLVLETERDIKIFVFFKTS